MRIHIIAQGNYRPHNWLCTRIRRDRYIFSEPPLLPAQESAHSLCRPWPRQAIHAVSEGRFRTRFQSGRQPQNESHQRHVDQSAASTDVHSHASFLSVNDWQFAHGQPSVGPTLGQAAGPVGHLATAALRVPSFAGKPAWSRRNTKPCTLRLHPSRIDFLPKRPPAARQRRSLPPREASEA